MQIRSTQFIKGIVGDDEVLEDGVPQIAFIGRSNVGKSSTINSLVKEKELARTSSFPGRTQQINIFLINKMFYLVDLPGYGYSQLSQVARNKIRNLINWYLFKAHVEQHLIVLIIDSVVGFTENDLEIVAMLEQHKKPFVIVANKVDKLKQSEYVKKMKKIKESVMNHTIIPYSSKKKIGIGVLIDTIVKTMDYKR